jgi:hypothetical protein
MATNNLELTIILSAQKKLFDNVKFLASDNVNSGSTYPGRTVVVWRLEELYKVLIHELIHYHQFDFGMNHPHYDELKQKMDGAIKFEGPDAINETYTETLAVIINAMFYAYYNRNDETDKLDDVEKLFHYAINLERRFLMWQVAKIVRIFGGETMQSLLNNEVKIVQTTSVRSYYVYKLFLLFNLNSFVEFIDSNSDICGLNICDRLTEFGDLILTSYEKFKTLTPVITEMDKYITMIDKEYTSYEKRLEELQNSGSEHKGDPHGLTDGGQNVTPMPWIYRTGRMTVIEIR